MATLACEGAHNMAVLVGRGARHLVLEPGLPVGVLPGVLLEHGVVSGRGHQDLAV